jgi:hypothetical protein
MTNFVNSVFARINISPAIEAAIREFIRVIVLAIIPVIIATLSNPDWTWKGFVVAAVVATLRAADKWLHENGSRFQLPV